MSSWARSFIWDNVPSEIYDMRVFRYESAGKENSPTGGNIQIIDKKIFRRPKPYFFGTTQNEVLTFPLVFGSFDAIDSTTRNAIEKWLFEQTNYKKLQIIHYDLDSIYYNCLLVNSQAIKIGNLNFAYQCDVVCDSPWAWEFPKTLSKTYVDDSVDSTFNFINNSANGDYLYPSLAFTLNALGSGITITNETDSNRQFIFTSLSPSETVTVDNDRQIITSDTGLRRLSGFNLKWFRLIPGLNTINVQGGVSSLDMTYQFASRMGG